MINWDIIKRGMISLFILVILTSLPAKVLAGEVSMVEFEYRPKVIEIKAGQTVRWVNNDIVVHTVAEGNHKTCNTNGTWVSKKLWPKNRRPGQDVYEKKFDESGIYKYICTMHCIEDEMVGEVVIKP